MKRIVLLILRISISCLWGLTVASWLLAFWIPIAYEKRGYFAFGGEWLASIETFLIISWITNTIIKKKGDELIAKNIPKNDTIDR